MTLPRNSRTESTALYIGAALLTFFCAYVVQGLWRADLRYPIAPLAGDGLSTQAVVFKGMVDNPWYLDNKFLGAPIGLNVRDFSGPDLLVLVVVKALTFFTKQHILIRNVIAIASYPLVALTSLYVMRRLSVRFSIAMVASLLFAFLGFHQNRIVAHTFLGIGYFSVPLATLLALGLFTNEPRFVTLDPERGRFRLLGNRQTWVALAWCLVIGMTGSVYFTFFSAYLWMVAGTFAALRSRSALPLVRSGLMVGSACAAMLVGLSPMILNNWAHGASNALVRDPQAAEVYGLKIAQLVTPGMGHRLAALQRFSEFYNRVAPLVNENSTAYLGVVGVVGFCYLLFVLLRGEQGDVRMRSLSMFNIAVLLLGTIGGFSSLISFFVSYMIRSYNRISVYNSFFALLALALLLECSAKKWVVQRRHQVALLTGLAGTLCLGLWDQCYLDVDYESIRKDYTEQAKFIEEVERSVPVNGTIFEYPYFQFPERPPMANLADYSEFMPYVHSKTLRWSYGTIKGRRGDAWQANIAGMATDQAIDALVQADFSGIFVFRDGYGDRAKGLEESLRGHLGRAKAVSHDGKYAFYSLLSRVAELRSSLGGKEFERRKDEALTPLYLGWLDGCYPPESSGNKPRIWCSGKGHFVIDNPSATPVHAVLEAKLHVNEPPVHVTLRSDVMNTKLSVETGQRELSEGFDIPPGEHIFTVVTDGPGKIDDNRRDLHVAFDDPHLEVIVRSSTFTSDAAKSQN